MQFLRVANSSDLGAAVDQIKTPDAFVIEELPTNHDGHFRKYCWILVDKKWYPWHRVAASSGKVDAFSSDLSVSAKSRSDDARFLHDPEAEMGTTAIRTLEQFATLLRFDFGGVDCDVDDAGRLMIFEANATMAVLPPGQRQCGTTVDPLTQSL
ncbi:MAG: hypothetical protein C7B45_09720 [Sulfobacillus acidophilus]|uniref:ATP-grasp domain-containing protein n=1 Tax=Sulfobacillus acidophilus TaxID=53633 RepID=A0A2T2WHP8_9FIRM|nr:MAG: hypothetical protein C7B45_09720 [Sulfobacillus acidophilus]